MRAAVLRGARIGIEDVDDPTPATGQILIAPTATGICGSDLHLREVMGELASAAPDAAPAIVPGHEFAGEVIAVGLGTETDLSPGDLVAANPFTHGASGPETIGISTTFTGGLAELTLADAIRTHRLPSGVDARLGALCEPIAVAHRALGRGASSGPIVVIGAGPIGLGIVGVASVADRRPIIVVEPSHSRRTLAERFGADAVFEPGTPMLDMLAAVGFTPSTISPLLGHDPAPVTVVECVGRAPIVQSIIAEAPPHAHVVLAGACPHTVQIEPLQLTTTEVTLTTTYAYRPDDFRAAADHLRRYPELFGRLVTSERALVDTGAAFDALAGEPDEIKILIRPNG